MPAMSVMVLSLPLPFSLPFHFSPFYCPLLVYHFFLSMEEAVVLRQRLAWESPAFSVCKEILTVGFILSDF